MPNSVVFLQYLRKSLFKCFKILQIFVYWMKTIQRNIKDVIGYSRRRSGELVRDTNVRRKIMPKTFVMGKFFPSVVKFTRYSNLIMAAKE